MLKYRLITALILIPLVIAALFLLPPLGVTVITFIVCLLATWEWGPLAGLDSRSKQVLFVLLCGLILIFLNIADYHKSVWFLKVNGPLWLSIAWWSGALLLVLFYPESAALWRHSCSLRIVFGLLTVVPFFWSVFVLRQHGYEKNQVIGAWWLFYVMLLVWSADSGAYVCGQLFGKHKLAPKISPGKTWEGLLGGVLVCTLIFWLFARYVPMQVSANKLFICSTVAVFSSVLGDLTESMFKREAGIKDSGNCIPGHGGILDRIDSLTAAVPIFTCLMLWG